MSKVIKWLNGSRRLGDLKVWEKNPMIISDHRFEKLSEQIKGFGFTTPLLVNTDDTIIAGHQRRKSLLKQYGEDYMVDVRYPSRTLTAREFEDLALGDNLNRAAFDYEKLNLKFDVDNLLGIGFDKLDLGINDKPIASDDNFTVPDKIKTGIVEGDLFSIGVHRLYCSDSTNKKEVELLMEGINPEIVFADPPYGISIVQGNDVSGDKSLGRVGGGLIVKAKTYSKIIGDKSTATAKMSYEVCKELGIEKFIIWGGNYFTDFLPPSMCWVIWNKEINGNFADVEMAWTSFHRSAKLYKWQWNGMIRKGEHKLEGKTRLAPTQKPVGLFIEIFNDFVFKTCYDPFLGSGTTMVACEQLNRICYGMEISTELCAVIVRRMKALVPAIEIRCLNREFDIEGEIQKALELK